MKWFWCYKALLVVIPSTLVQFNVLNWNKILMQIIHFKYFTDHLVAMHGAIDETRW